MLINFKNIENWIFSGSDENFFKTIENVQPYGVIFI